MFNELQGAISRKIELFTNTAVITSNPIEFQYQFCKLFGEAYQTCSVLRKTAYAFIQCGMRHINADTFTDHKFLLCFKYLA
jgi:hypothetical protein